MSYLLVTPVKDEEKNLPKLADCIIHQTILPSIWVILNDNSTDTTPSIIKKLEDQYSWIKGIHTKEVSTRDLDEHFGAIYHLAFEEALQYCKETQTPVEYLVKIDADILLPYDCMEQMITELDKNTEIGIASPQIIDEPYQPVGQEILIREYKTKNNTAWYDLLQPRDGLRFYRYATYQDIGGIPSTMAPDTVALTKAKLRGWNVTRFTNILCYNTRETSSSIQSIFYGYFLQGLRRYYLDYPLSMLIFNIILEFVKGRPRQGAAVFLGFFSGVINKKEKINDSELRDYYHNKRPKEMLHQLLRGKS